MLDYRWRLGILVVRVRLRMGVAKRGAIDGTIEVSEALLVVCDNCIGGLHP